ncbi:MAG: prephenate dehydrogenase/arogenate dehydrogenase family protein [Lentisphaerae bacterium]|nr:prephenate dehydrogenase/arogenate dehydrogenase family protein [Lentisphaerota bacterium]
MRVLAVMGLGLMGGSLGLAVRRRGLAAEVRGYARRKETRERALRDGVADTVWANPSDAVRGADITVLCVPVLAIPVLAAECRPGFGAGAIVTDVGSTKDFICRELSAMLAGTGAVFVGSHPIAGSEETGLDAARADLYDGAVSFVTPGDGDGQPEAAGAVAGLWESVGCIVRVLAPGAHDRILARTSHLPHLAAAMLVDNAFARGADGVEEACGSGFRDATRIAAGSEEVWHDIVRTNAEALTEELDSLIGRAVCLRDMIADGRFGEVRAFLASARRRREAMRGGRKAPDGTRQA